MQIKCINCDHSVNMHHKVNNTCPWCGKDVYKITISALDLVDYYLDDRDDLISFAFYLKTELMSGKSITISPKSIVDIIEIVPSYLLPEKYENNEIFISDCKIVYDEPE